MTGEEEESAPWAAIPADHALALRAIVAAHFNETPRTITNAFGHRSVSYTVRMSSATVVIRMNSDPRAFSFTAENIDAMRHLDLPVPQVLAVDVGQTLVPRSRKSLYI